MVMGILVHGLYIGENEYSKKDGSRWRGVGVAVGTKSYQVNVRAEDAFGASWNFGEEVCFLCSFYSTVHGLYITGTPVAVPSEEVHVAVPD